MPVENRLSSRWGSLGGVVVALALSACAVGPTQVPVATSTSPAQQSPAAAQDARPAAYNTGVPDGVRLRPSGPLRITTDGAVIDSVDVDGCVEIAADNVVIRNSRIRCSNPTSEPAVRVLPGASGLVMEDSEVDGLGRALIGVGYSGFTLVRVDIHGVNDGVRVASRTVVQDSWIHDLARQGEYHPDAIQSTSGSSITIRGNTLDAASDGDLNNAALMLGTETGNRVLDDVVIEDNYLNGGNYTVNVRHDANIEHVVLAHNVFGPDHRYGHVLAPPSLAVPATNADEATGAPVGVDLAR